MCLPFAALLAETALPRAEAGMRKNRAKTHGLPVDGQATGVPVSRGHHDVY
jgi:hypothetical protein